MRKVNLGLIGCGASLYFMYGPYFRYIDNANLYGAYDKDKAKTIEAKTKYGAQKIYSSYEEMLADPAVEAVMVCTPTEFHCDNVIQAARAGKHIYCEKPMARTLKEAESMILECRKNKVKLMVAFIKRFNKGLCLAKKIIEEKGIGDIFEVRARWDKAHAKPTGYREKISSGGGIIQEDGSHPIDVLRWWLGEVEHISAEMLLVAKDLFENEDVASLQMKHASGAMSSLNLSRLTHKMGEESYELFGTKGTLVVEVIGHDSPWTQPPRMRIYTKGTEIKDITPYNSWNLDEELKTGWQFVKELEHFCSCIVEDKEPSVTGLDGRAAIEIISAAYLSADKKEKIKLPVSTSPEYSQIFKDLKKKSKWRIGFLHRWWAGY